MNSQGKYIIEAALAILAATIIVASIRFLSSSALYYNPKTEEIDSYTMVKEKSINSLGRSLFMSNCASCHALNKILTGPALAKIEERVPDKKLLIAWIKNNKKVLRSGNAYFNKLYKDYNQISMTLFPTLEDDQVEAILSYIKEKENPVGY